MDSIKNSAEPLLNYWTTTYLMSRLPSFLSSCVIDMMCDQCSLVVSNVPGPQIPMIMNSDQVEKAVFWPPQRSDVGKYTFPASAVTGTQSIENSI